ncbi:MAG: hypothetical protein WAZ18_05900 [Alphaproteobacteria bacterium]
MKIVHELHSPDMANPDDALVMYLQQIAGNLQVLSGAMRELLITLNTVQEVQNQQEGMLQCHEVMLGWKRID